MDTLFSSIVSNSKFLYSSFYGYSNQDVIDFFEGLGVRTKIERGERVFPASDHSSDVIRAMEKEMRRLGVKAELHAEVTAVRSGKGRFDHIELSGGRKVTGDACIVATGGLSYQSTGSTGDGYRFAEENGHRITECMPSLVPMEINEPWISSLQGLSLRNVTVTLYQGGRESTRNLGKCCSPIMGSAVPLSSAPAVMWQEVKEQNLRLEIDLKPALDEDQWITECSGTLKRTPINSLRTR